MNKKKKRIQMQIPSAIKQHDKIKTSASTEEKKHTSM
jgi:hypothetical protein